MEGIERLQAEVLEMNNHNISIIFDYLKTREDLKECFNNEEKSIKQMYDYMYDKANKLKQDNMAMVQDNVVYLWAVTYFKKRNEELGIKKEEKVMTPKTDEVIKKIEEKKQKEEPKDNQITLFDGGAK